MRQVQPGVVAIGLQHTPKVGIGQRAYLIETPHGRLLWDMVAHLDADTEARIKQLGGIKVGRLVCFLWTLMLRCPACTAV